MHWPVAEAAEVVRRPHQPLAEVAEPDAVDHDTSSQRVIVARQPFRQLAPSTLAGVQWCLALTGQDVWEVSRYFRTERQMTAANVNADVLRLPLGDGHRLRWTRCALFQRGQFTAKPAQLRSRLF